MIEITDIGQLTERVLIEVSTVTVSTNGERVNSWATYATRWAKVEPSTGDEMVNDDLALALTTAVFTIRYDSSLDSSYRLYWNSQYWEIRHLTFDSQRMFMQITAQTTQL